jgi:acetylornithine deacetylase/succinyl-diaminopimelate desuccinylase-like protein
VDKTLAAVLDHIDANLDASLSRLFALVRIPSISTDPAHKADCQKAADWLAAELAGLGFDASARRTTGHPMVVAHAKGRAGKPHVLFYAHYDVQPVDPVDLWTTPPFEPTLVPAADGETWIVARGTSDDKGQLMTFVEACRAWMAVNGALPISVTILSEGEEESGSPSLQPFLEANRDELSLDLALVCDTDMWDPKTPAITTMLRGLVGEEVEIACANRDLHSGMFGGAARNPIHLLAEILSGLHDTDGKVTLAGFYDGVEEVPPAVKKQWKALSFDEAAFLGDVGLSIAAGEKGRSVLEQIWARPTCEVNGIQGGYTGQGFKTVIASKASAKVSFRLVGKQDPAKIRSAFQAYVRSRLPADCTVSFKSHIGSPATSLPADGELLGRARTALSEEWGRDAAIIGSGGSIPIVGDFKRFLGMDSLLIGFAQIDNRIHSPNEKYDLSSFHGGIRSWARILSAFAAGQPT